MLILSRKKQEVIVIEVGNGELIKITVCDIVGSQVRIGIDAPKAIPVHREEIYNKKFTKEWRDKDAR